MKSGRNQTAAKGKAARRRTATKQKTKGKKLNPAKKKKYLNFKLVGAGTFGSVYRAKTQTGKVVAIKKVLQDPHYKNRELIMMKEIQSRYCIKMLDHFMTKRNAGKDIYLNIVMDYFPYSLHTYTMKLKSRGKKFIPLMIKIFSYQIFAGLRYMHARNIVHRDIKPENILISTATGRLKICDFGSAKKIQDGEKSISYIASRFYRAPELVLGCEYYSGAVDIWAAGCVIAEMWRMGEALFEGESGIEQIKPIIKIIGPPKQSDLDSFEHTEKPKPSLKQTSSLEKELPKNAPPELLALLKRIFDYNPKTRITASEAMKSDYFKELFIEGKLIPNTDKPVASLFPK